MDAIRAAFESQFGTQWSAPVANAEADKAQTKSTKPYADSGPESDEDAAEFTGFDSEADHSELSLEPGLESENDGPVTVKHSETGATQQPVVSKAQRRRFMASGAPKDDSVLPAAPVSKEENEDLQNDLALQRLIEESHILTEAGSEFSGADISGAVDPMDHVGKTRLKVMEARLQKAGAKKTGQRMPQAMAVGIRDKRAERTKRSREESREAGIVIAKDRHERSKSRRRDTGLKINTVGRASEHGIHISPAEIAKFTGKNKRPAKRRR